MNLISLGDSARDNPYLQLAESLKYSSACTARIAELQPGLFALYQGITPIYVGEDWDELLAAFRARPPQPSKQRPLRRTIDLAELRI